MNYLQRAMVSIKRRLGKTVILLSVLFILGNVLVGAIAIRQAINNTESRIRTLLPPLAYIHIDGERLVSHYEQTGEWLAFERLDLETVSRIGGLPYVRAYDISKETWIEGRNIVRANAAFEMEEGIFIGEIDDDFQGFEHVNLKGIQNLNMVDIQSGNIAHVAGRNFTQEELDNGYNMGMISDRFAEMNNLDVGSTFTLEHVVFDFRGLVGGFGGVDVEDYVHQEMTKDIIVIGIFEVKREFADPENPWNAANQKESMLNRIYLPNAVVEEFIRFDFEARTGIFPDFFGENATVGEFASNFFSIFALDDARNLGAFAETANELLPDGWRIGFMSNNFRIISSSMDSILWFADMTLWAGVSGSIFIIGLLMILFLRDRKYEIGIYLALGEKKIKLVLQILLEVLPVAAIAITLAIFSGTLFSSGLSRQMLEDQLSYQQEIAFKRPPNDPVPWEWDFGDISFEEMLEMYDASLDAMTIIMFYAIGIGTALLSTAIPILYVVRLQPKNVLM